jgi:hypothetical protein
MNARAAARKRLVVLGAAGMVGGYALRYALDHPGVGHVTAIGRRKLAISHPKLDEAIRTLLRCGIVAIRLSRQSLQR